MNPFTSVTRGQGADVVLVHGALGDYRQWTDIGHGLAERFRVTAISRRYHWPNPAPPSGAGYTYEAQRDDLLAFLATFARPVHLVGHSYGAGIVLLAALAEPPRARSLVLIEPSFGSLLDVNDAALQPELASRKALLDTTQRLSGAGDDEAASIALIDWLQESDRGFDSLAEPVRAGLLANAATVGPTFAVAAPPVTCEALGALGVPALLLHGARTRLFFRRVAERAAACLPQARLAEIPDCGHMSIVENPAAVASRIRDFIVQN